MTRLVDDGCGHKVLIPDGLGGKSSTGIVYDDEGHEVGAVNVSVHNNITSIQVRDQAFDTKGGTRVMRVIKFSDLPQKRRLGLPEAIANDPRYVELPDISEVYDLTAGYDYVEFDLIPVYVFGGCDERCCDKHDFSNWSYGIGDADEVGSDCNRAIGRIYRLQDVPMTEDSNPEEHAPVLVRREDLKFFVKKWSDG